MSVYDRTHPAKRHSAALTDGVDRAPARAMLKGAGFTDVSAELVAMCVLLLVVSAVAISRYRVTLD